MVMRPDPRVEALTTVRRRRMGPWWLWTIVVILAAIAAYAGYMVRTLQQDLAVAEAARLALIADKDRLKTNLLVLREQLDQANQSGAKLRAALNQSRADAEAASASMSELQKRLMTLQSDVTAARVAADESKREAERLGAKAASAEIAFKQVRKLQEGIAGLKVEIAAARAETDESKKAAEQLITDATAAAEAKSALEREIISLKSQLSVLQQKLDAATAEANRTEP